MKRITLILIFIAACFQNAIASEISINFDKIAIQKACLDTPIDDSNVSAFSEDWKQGTPLFFHQKIIVENEGEVPLNHFYLSVKPAVESDQENWMKASQWLKSGSEDIPSLQSLGLPFRLAAFNDHAALEFQWDNDWHLMDANRQTFYLNWDNRSIAAYEDILDDPLLALRTKVHGKRVPMDIVKSLANFAQFEMFNPKAYSLEESSSQDIFRAFDLFPGEKLVYHINEFPFDNQKSDLAKIEQTVNLQQRGSAFSFESGTPIYRITNSSASEIHIEKWDLTLSPGETYNLQETDVFNLHLVAEKAEGELSVYSLAVRSSLPLLSKGDNLVSLGTESTPSSVKVTYVTNSDLELQTLPLVQIENKEEVFDQIAPSITIKSNSPCEKIWWQISQDENFDFVIPNFEAIQTFQENVDFDPLTQTFFTNDTAYHFRARALQNGLWSNWSTPFTFKVLKPNAPSQIQFEKIGQNQFEISWEADNTPDTTYLIFASNAIDFIPSIYFDKQANAMWAAEISEFEPNQCLLNTTNKSSITIDQQYAFYRIVAERKGQYSTPSALVYVYDRGLSFPRTVLQAANIEEAERIPFPQAYTYLDEIAGDEPTKDLLVTKTLASVDLKQIASPALKSRKNYGQANYAPNPYVSEETWNAVKPYLLPENHPIKNKLDRIFSTRVTLNSNTIKKAKFENNEARLYSKAVITKHPKLKGYYIKMYMDSQAGIDDAQQWITRVTGAMSIQDYINRNNLHKYFKVPQKWIYPLPPEPSPHNGAHRKNFILVAEDMKILERKKNKSRWRKKMCRPMLNQIYSITLELGLADCLYAFNMPFGKDGRIAFIDTEHHHKWPVPLGNLLRYLSPEMQAYWTQLMHHGLPAK
jgi:hypothetical protein